MWIDNNIWLEKGPVPLWFMAISISVFGNSDVAIRIPTLIFALLAIYLTFLIGKYLFNERIGLLAAFLHAINGLVLEIGSGKLSSDHVETFFDIFIEIAILYCILSIIRKNKYYLSFLGGIFMGLAVLSKWLPALIVLPVWLTGAIFTRKYTIREIIQHFMIILSGCLIIALPWFINILLNFPLEAKWVIRKFLFAYSTTIENHNAPWWYYINYVEIIFGELVYIPLIYALYILFKDKREWALKLLSIWWILPVIIFSFAETKRHTYLMLSSPAFFLITAWFWYQLQESHAKRKYVWVKQVILWLLILLPVRLNIERMKPFEQVDKNPAWAQELRTLNQEIPEKKVVIFNSERPIETMFYTDFVAYSGSPDSTTLIVFLSNGYIPYMYKAGSPIRMSLPYKK
jgi:4-amino-4-deoxy-L-arabinose transferase-like glycosyltransferase